MNSIRFGLILTLTAVSAVRSQNFSSQETNALCRAQLQAVLLGVEANEIWALRCKIIVLNYSSITYFDSTMPFAVYDSWGKWPSGQFSGNQYDFGNYDQCREYVHQHADVGLISGRYCMVVVPQGSDLNRIFIDTGG